MVLVLVDVVVVVVVVVVALLVFGLVPEVRCLRISGTGTAAAATSALPPPPQPVRAAAAEAVPERRNKRRFIANFCNVLDRVHRSPGTAWRLAWWCRRGVVER